MTKAELIEMHIADICRQYANGVSKRDIAKRYDVAFGYFIRLWNELEGRGIIPADINEQHELNKNAARTQKIQMNKDKIAYECIWRIKKSGLADKFILAYGLKDKDAIQECAKQVARNKDEYIRFIVKNFVDIANALDKEAGALGYYKIWVELTGIETVNQFTARFGGCAVIADRVAGTEYAISTLSENEAKLIRLRYFSGKMYEELGTVFGVSAERIRQVHNKIIRKLKHPSRYRYILYGYEGTLKRIEEQEIEKKRKIEEQSRIMKESAVSCTKSSTIDELGLSNRAHTALRRNGIRTAGEIPPLKQLKMMRWVGDKTAEEIVTALKDRGILSEKGYNLAEENKTEYTECTPTDELGLSAKAWYGLSRNGIYTLGEIPSIEQLKKMNYIGEKVAEDIATALLEKGILLEE